MVCTLGKVTKGRIISHLDNIHGDVSTLLWFVPTLWHGTAAQILRAQRSKIEFFKSVVDRYKRNVDKTCGYMQKCI